MANRIMLTAVAAALAAIAATPSALAQGDTGFLRGRAKLDVALSYSLDTYDSFWNGDRRVESPPFGRVDRQTFNVYAAYGLTDDIDLTINASYVWTSTGAVFADESDPQDIALSAKCRLASQRVGPGTLTLLVAPGVRTPLTDYENNAVNALGDGETSVLLHGIIQYAFDSGVFLALDTGYDLRLEGVPDAVPVHLTVGATFGRATLTGFYSHITSLGGYDLGGGPFPGVDEEYDRIGAGLYLRLTDQLGLSASVWTTLDGKNTGDVDGFSIGTVLRF